MNDPYFDTDLCVDRLVDQWRIHGSLIVATDFDDVLFDYHKKGYTYTRVIELLKKCQSLGFTLILLTTTENPDFSFQVNYCASLGIEILWVNEGPVMRKARKPFFNVYLDDKAGLGEAYNILWSAIKKIEEIKERKLND